MTTGTTTATQPGQDTTVELPPHDFTTVSLDDPRQSDKATEAFFPTIARHGRSYNLFLPQKVRSADAGPWRDLFGPAWTPELDAAACAGLLYVIDLRIYETLHAQTVDGATRFTPSTPSRRPRSRSPSTASGSVTSASGTSSPRAC